MNLLRRPRRDVPGFAVVVHPRVVKELKRLERAGRRDVVEWVREAVRLMEDDPITPRVRFDIRMVQGAPEGTFRLRIGDYRVLFEVDISSKVVNVTRVSRRPSAYRF